MDNLSESSEEQEWNKLEQKKKQLVQKLRVLMMEPVNNEEHKLKV